MFINLENENLKVSLSTYAGGIESIINKETGNEHYWHYNSQYWPRRTPVCFPICGGLTDNEYTYNCKTYSLPMHGFLRENEMRIVSQSDTKLVMEFVSNEETLKVYPFEFRFTLTQELQDDAFIVTYTAENTGSGPMYFSMGSHSTYKAPIIEGESMQEDYALLFEGPQNASRLVLENGLVAGKTDDIFNGSDRLPLKNMFENGSTILELKDIHPNKISVFSLKSGALTSVECEGFTYCVLWAPKGENPFVCIEPWTGMVDQKGHDKDITKKLGISCLQPGESQTARQIIRVR